MEGNGKRNRSEIINETEFQVSAWKRKNIYIGEKKMKRNITMLIAAFSIIAMANSQAMAASYDLDLEEDMAEGITLSTPAEVKVYKYDNSIPDPGELMGEGIIFAVEQKDEKEYVGDASMPSMHNLIGEGICLEGKSGLIAVK